MKIQTSIKLLACAGIALFGATAVARAQYFVSPETEAGLLGQTYTGVDASYVHRTSGLSRAVHHFGFVSNTLLPELHNTDGAFRYGYTRESSNGVMSHQHEVSAAFTRFAPQGDGKIFVEGDVGWAWRREGGVSNDSSFLWRAAIGAELRVAPRVVFTPYVSYQETSSFEQNFWNFGAKLTRRFDRDWSGSAGLAFDDERNVIWSLGLQRRF